MNKTIVAALIGASATIVAAIVGVTFGKNMEQNQIQNQIDEIIGDVVNIVGDSNDVTVNDVESLAQNYVQLCKDYDELESNNTFLTSQNKNYVEELNEANNKIKEFESQTNKKIKDMQEQILSKYDVDFKNISLTINGIDSGYIDKVASINNELFYSIGFLQYLVDNQAVNSENSRLFIGKVQSEKQMPTSLFELNFFTKGYSLWKTLNEEDTYGNNYPEVFQVKAIKGDNEELLLNATEYYLNKEYSSFSFEIAYAKKANQNTNYEILIYGDEKLLKSITIDRKSQLQKVEVDVSKVDFLKIISRSEISTFNKECYCLMINPYLYP